MIIIKDWTEKDELQKMLTIFVYDLEITLNNAIQYRYLINLLNENNEFINNAPSFFSQIISSLRYSLIMRTAKIIDESKDGFGFKKILNKLEQSEYREAIKENLNCFRNEYIAWQETVLLIKFLRDKVYAHNDKIFYYKEFGIGEEVAIDTPIWLEIEPFLLWLYDSSSAISKNCENEIFPRMNLINDVTKLVEKL